MTTESIKTKRRVTIHSTQSRSRSTALTLAEVSPALAAVFAVLAAFVIVVFGYDTVPEIALPEARDVVSIKATLPDGEVITHTDDEFIETALAGMSAARRTSTPSVSYTPVEEGAVIVTLNSEKDETHSLFLYRKNGRHYIEQPCHGVYETNAAVFDLFAGFE